MKHTVIDGIISDLDRTTHVSGGETTSTTHISIFNISGERVLLRTRYPAMIVDGDHLKLVGIRGQGQFTAIACKNITTGWTTKFKRQGCMITALTGFGLIGMLLSYFFAFFIILPLISGVIVFLMLMADSENKTAHKLLNQ